MSFELLSLVVLGIFILAGCSALCSAIETALFSLQPFHLERLKSRRADFADDLARLMENPRRLLGVILLCDSLANLPLIILSLALFRTKFGPAIPSWVAAFPTFVLVVFACDLFPKLGALANPDRFARLGIRILRVLTVVFDPVARILQRVSDGVADRITPAGLKAGNFLNEDELETLVELSAEDGALHATESTMIQEIIKLGAKTAKDCMTPRVDAFAVPDDLTHAELIPLLRSKRYRRVPVYGDTPDEIAGVLDVRSFLLNSDVHYTEQLSPPSFVSETMKAIDLLRSFLQHPQGLAIVLDEHGGTEGIVTLADLIEEILSTAVPQADQGLYIESVAGGLIVNGNARLDDLGDLLGHSLEEEGMDTIGGLVFNHFGGLPKLGTEVLIGGLLITVRRNSRKRVEELFIARPTDPQPAEESQG